MMILVIARAAKLKETKEAREHRMVEVRGREECPAYTISVLVRE